MAYACAEEARMDPQSVRRSVMYTVAHAQKAIFLILNLHLYTLKYLDYYQSVGVIWNLLECLATINLKGQYRQCMESCLVLD